MPLADSFSMLPKSTTSSTPDTTLWQVHLPNVENKYWQDLNLSRGFRQVIVEHLLAALAAELRKSIPVACWDPDNDSLVMTLIANINFTKPKSNVKSTKSRRTNPPTA